MTDEQINIRVAKILGFPIRSDGITHCLTTCDMRGKYNQDGPLLKRVPNYAADLNACHEFEKLTAKQCQEGDYWFYLREVLDFPDAESEWDKFYFFPAVHATARQRCEAFLRVHGQWEEEA